MKNIFQKEIKVDLVIEEKEQQMIEEVMNRIFIQHPKSGLFFYLFVSRFGEKVYGNTSGYKVENSFNQAVEDAVKEYKRELSNKKVQ